MCDSDGGLSKRELKAVEIWIEAEEWPPSEWDIADHNTDVAVTLSDGSRWIATFFTYQNVLSPAKKNQETGECLSGAYFWATEMILVDEVSSPRIEEIVHHLVTFDGDDFRKIFSPDENAEFDPDN